MPPLILHRFGHCYVRKSAAVIQMVAYATGGFPCSVTFLIDGKRYEYHGDCLDVQHIVKVGKYTPGKALNLAKKLLQLVPR
jgi:hypothetical protein